MIEADHRFECEATTPQPPKLLVLEGVRDSGIECPFLQWPLAA
jgi:hypothetical protein